MFLSSLLNQFKAIAVELMLQFLKELELVVYIVVFLFSTLTDFEQIFVSSFFFSFFNL